MEWLINIQEKDDEMIVVTFLNKRDSELDAVCSLSLAQNHVDFFRAVGFHEDTASKLDAIRVKIETRKKIYYRWNNLPNRVNKLRAEFC